MYLPLDGCDVLTERETPLCFLILAFGMAAVCRGHALSGCLGDVRSERRIVGHDQLDSEIDDGRVRACENHAVHKHMGCVT